MPGRSSAGRGPVACGTGTAYGALRRMHLAGGSTLAVFGQGPVGLSATLLGAKMGARVIAVETNAQRRALAKQFGADEAIDAPDAEKALKEMTHGEGVDLALDCTGIAAARVAAGRPAKTWGTACFVGAGGEVTLDVSRDMLRKQLTLIGSWTFSAMGQAECARYVAEIESAWRGSSRIAGRWSGPTRPTVCSTPSRRARA